MRFLSIVLLLAAAIAMVSARDLVEKDYQTAFSTYVKKHSKQYTHDEFFPRYNIFKANFDKIRLHNMGNHSFSMAVNEFADMTFTEFHAKMTGYNHIERPYLRALNYKGPHLHVKAPAAAIDWRTKNAVTPVKNQGQCGSCWSFSSTGSMEGAWAISKGQLISLSEQQLIDCSTAQGNQGCNGGLMDQAFQFVISNKGICSEASYPYTTSGPNTCQTTCENVATISSYTDVTPNSESALQAALNVGPVSVAIEADQECFQFYSGGVLSDPACGTQLDHGVLVVGYGTDATSKQPFWIIKNSWGASWGEAGYIRVLRGSGSGSSGECGLATEPSYPVV